MIKPTCRRCGNELDKPGGIYLSAPFAEHKGIDVVEKRHICKDCEADVIAFIENKDCWEKRLTKKEIVKMLEEMKARYEE